MGVSSLMKYVSNSEKGLIRLLAILPIGLPQTRIKKT